MKPFDLVLYPDKRLNQVAEFVTDFGGELAEQAQQMLVDVKRFKGYALAAPQVGVNKRFFVVSDHPGLAVGPLVVCNPIIALSTDAKIRFKESCLSLPGIAAWNERYPTVKLHFQDVNGEQLYLEADGLLAIVLQHELDHLDGKLFIDQLSTYDRNHVAARINKLRR